MKLFLGLVLAAIFAIFNRLPYVSAQSPIAPFPDAPECTNHNPTLYHGLWNEVDGCHYDHTHGDNPHEVDDIFGTGYYTLAGGEISYPWATDGENHENHKHEGYKWFVRRDLPCQAQFVEGCVRAFRAQPHADLHNVASEYHSYSVEALVCREAQPDNCGIIRFGGWQAAGDLKIDNIVTIDRQEPDKTPRPTLLHYDTVGNANFATWYPISPSGLVRLSTQTEDMWGVYHLPPSVPVPTLGMADFDFFCEVDENGNANAGCTNNGSRTQPHNINFAFLPRYRSTLDPDNDRIINYQGYVNRYGAFVQGCSGVSLDCIPISYENVLIPADNQWQGNGETREYDVYFGDQPSGWIKFPN